MGKIVGNAILSVVGLLFLIIGLSDPPKLGGGIIAGGLFLVLGGMNLKKLLSQRNSSNQQGGGSRYSIFDLDMKVRAIGEQLIQEAPADWRQFDFFIERSGTAYTCRVAGPGQAPLRPSYAVQRLVNELTQIVNALGRHTRLICSATQNSDGGWTVKMAPEDRV